MVKLTAKTIGKLINRSPKYVYHLLRKKGIVLKDIDYEKLIDMVAEYRHRRYIFKKGSGRVVRLKHMPIKRKSAIQVIDKTLYGRLSEVCREWANGKCTICGKPGDSVHHIDTHHKNTVFENLMYLCSACHCALHRGDIQRGGIVGNDRPNEKRFYFTYKDIALVTGRNEQTIRNHVATGKLVPGDLMCWLMYIVKRLRNGEAYHENNPQKG